MVTTLSSFADEVTRVAGEGGTARPCGGQAQGYWLSGAWRDLTDSVNGMADKPHRTPRSRPLAGRFPGSSASRPRASGRSRRPSRRRTFGFSGEKFIVDDDIRNVFALTSVEPARGALRRERRGGHRGHTTT
ncbi:hypothetical protein STANM309S_04654 [Streptomyces tanashiensis]